ncbi:MAG: GreA/GreB family elongation factor [Geminicoccaceae bacterium]
MSRAFVREDDGIVVAPMPDRPISPHPNFVTERGLALIDAELQRWRHELATATDADDQEAMGRANRELRYWSARRSTAQVTVPDADADRVVFGALVELERTDGKPMRLRIVGEDEADPVTGRIAWTTPVASALLGAEAGDSRRLPTGEVEILAIQTAPEPVEA